uniref:Uncharacterized protein n=1 Tax=Biomphalaria glabrata TaxID=6526 RepID=A0A182YU60_BIOGL
MCWFYFVSLTAWRGMGTKSDIRWEPVTSDIQQSSQTQYHKYYQKPAEHWRRNENCKTKGRRGCC